MILIVTSSLLCYNIYKNGYKWNAIKNVKVALQEGVNAYFLDYFCVKLTCSF